MSEQIPERSRKIVAIRSGGRCEAWRVCQGATAEHVHHRRPRGMGGTSDKRLGLPSNLLHVCPPCHDWIESNRTAAFDAGLLLAAIDDPSTTPAEIRPLYGFGWWLLDDEGCYTGHYG